MRTDHLRRALLPVLLSLLGPPAPVPSTAASAQLPTPPSATAASHLTEEAVGILRQNCWNCHSGSQPTGGLNMTSRQTLLGGGVSGSAVSPSRPDDGLLLRAINYRGRQMP